MAIISTLGVSLRANTKRFTSAMRRASRVTSKVIRAFRGLTRVVAPLTMALGGLGGLSFVAIFQQTRKWADEVGKLSDELGIAVDKLMGLRFAAELTGTSVSILTKGLQRMNRRIGEANAGYGEGVKGLADLGLEAKDLAGLSAFDQFKKIADATAAMGTQADKSAAVYTLFGRQGALLLNMFALQGEGLDEVTKKLKRLMGEMTRVDVRQIEHMNDKIVELQMSLKGFAFNALVKLAPTIAAFVDALTEGFVVLRKVHLPGMIKAIGQGVSRMIDTLSQIAPYMITNLIQMKNMAKLAFGIVTSSIRIAAIGFQTLGAVITGQVTSLGGLLDKVNNVSNLQLAESFTLFSSLAIRSIGSVGKMLGNLTQTAFIVGKSFAAGFTDEKVRGQIDRFLNSFRTQFHAVAVFLGKAITNAFRPDGLARLKTDFISLVKTMDDAKLDKMGALKNILAPYQGELDKLKAAREKIISDIADGAVADVERLKALNEAIQAALQKIRDYKQEEILPKQHFGLNDEDTTLLKKLFSPVALFKSQAATKILAEAGMQVAPKLAVEVAVYPVIDMSSHAAEVAKGLAQVRAEDLLKRVNLPGRPLPASPAMPDSPDVDVPETPDWMKGNSELPKFDISVPQVNLPPEIPAVFKNEENAKKDSEILKTLARMLLAMEAPSDFTNITLEQTVI